jgi:multiple sugar transport system substrate-binding protein
MKKKILALCLLCAVLAALFGCSSGGGNDKIKLSFLRLGNDEAEKTFWLSVIDAYEADHPDVVISYDDAAIGSDMDTKLTNLFSANSGPDIIGHGILSIASRAEAGQYIPLTDYYNSWSGKDDLMDQLVSLGTYKDEVYGLAYMPAPYVFAYRTDLFEQAGISAPPTTWEELEEYARLLTVKENGTITRAGFAFPTSGGNLVEYDVFAYGNGGGFVGDDGAPTLNTPENLEALEFLAGIVNDVSIPYNSHDTNPFMTGNAAMTLIDNVKLLSMLSNPDYAGKVAIALPPSNTGKAQMTFSGCRLLFIGKDCKNPDAAFDFISYTLSQSVVLKRAQDLKVPVVLDSLVDQYSGLDEFNAVRAACVENGIGMPIVTWSTSFQTVRNELVQAVENGADPAAALAEAQAKLEQEIVNAGK